MFLPGADTIFLGGRLNVLGDPEPRGFLPGSYEPPLESGRSRLTIPSFKHATFGHAGARLPLRRGRVPVGILSIFLHRQTLLRWFIFLLSHIGQTPRPLGTAVGERPMGGICGVRKARQRDSTGDVGHFYKRIMGRGWYEYSSCHS